MNITVFRYKPEVAAGTLLRHHRIVRRILYPYCAVFLALVSGCSTPRQHSERPVLLLLEGSEAEWAALPRETRRAFSDHVWIGKTTVDELVHRPEVLKNVIGFLCANPSAFEPIRYLSVDSVYPVQADTSLHLFRRRTRDGDVAEHLRPLFTRLESLSPRVGWNPPPGRAEIHEQLKRDHQLTHLLETTLLGEFTPDSYALSDLCNTLERVAREAGAEFNPPLFSIQGHDDDSLPSYARIRPERERFNLTPGTTLLDALREISLVYESHFWIYNGRIMVQRRASRRPPPFADFRINTERFKAFLESEQARIAGDPSSMAASHSLGVSPRARWTEEQDLLPFFRDWVGIHEGRLHFQEPDILQGAVCVSEVTLVEQMLYIIHTEPREGTAARHFLVPHDQKPSL